MSASVKAAREAIEPKPAEVRAAVEKAAAKVPARSRDTGKRNVSGVWMVYERDSECVIPVVTSPHADELEARRAAMDGPTGSRVVFVRWGQSVAEALG